MNARGFGAEKEEGKKEAAERSLASEIEFRRFAAAGAPCPVRLPLNVLLLLVR